MRSQKTQTQKSKIFTFQKNILRPWTKLRFGHHSLLLSRDLNFHAMTSSDLSDDVISQLNAKCGLVYSYEIISFCLFQVMGRFKI